MVEKGRVVMAVALVVLLAVSVAAAGSEKVSGYAEYRVGEYLIVDGQRIQADKSTRFSSRLSGLAAIPLGHEVIVRGRRRGDGSILASGIEARSNREESVETQLKAGFDQIEKQYLQSGRMSRTDEKGKTVEDYGELTTQGPEAARVRTIMTRLAPAHVASGSLRTYVVKNDEWNAMAAPNYSVYVFSGLLTSLDDDEVAIVLGHELAHATHEHSRRQATRSQWTSIGAIAATLVVGETIDNDLGRTAAQMGTLLTVSAMINGYSREHEDQADRVGLRYAWQAGFDVTKGPRLWNRFAGKYGESGKAVNFFFGGHSRSSRRAALLSSEISNNYRR